MNFTKFKVKLESGFEVEHYAESLRKAVEYVQIRYGCRVVAIVDMDWQKTQNIVEYSD